MAIVRSLVAMLLALLTVTPAAQGQVSERAVDIPTRTGVTERMLVLSPSEPKAALILFTGGHGGLQLSKDGSISWGQGNFLVRTRKMYADRGMFVVVVDAPSDRLSPPFLSGFRQSSEHAADIKAVIAWTRQQAKVPVWLVGTSRGTQSAAFVATELAERDGPDGLVLTSTILIDDRGRPVPAMPVGKLTMPVLVVHHEHDSCRACPYAEIPTLMQKLTASKRAKLISINGGTSRGDPCEAFAHHGFNGQESEVVDDIARFILEH